MAYAISVNLGKAAVQALAVPFLCMQLQVMIDTAKAVMGLAVKALNWSTTTQKDEGKEAAGRTEEKKPSNQEKISKLIPGFVRRAFADLTAMPTKDSVKKTLTYALVGSAGMFAVSRVLGGAPLAARAVSCLGSNVLPNAYSAVRGFVGR